MAIRNAERPVLALLLLVPMSAPLASTDVPTDPALAGEAMPRLVARARAGDAAAFSALIEANYGFVFATAFKWCGQRSDAEDIAQEVSIKLATVLADFDGRSTFSTWLYRITLNAVRDLQRSRSRFRRHVDAYAELTPAVLHPEQDDAVAMAELWRAVRALPERQRDAVLLVHAEGLSHREVAEILGCKEATVSWHVHEAKKTLRGLL